MFRTLLITAFSLFIVTLKAEAFCGFYVAQADADLFNNSSKVAIARKGERTVVTMANDYQGELSEFAIVIPVPVVLSKDQVHVTTPDGLNALDAFSAPRLVEYHDGNPCQPEYLYEQMENEAGDDLDSIIVTAQKRKEAIDFGVTIEDQFAVGEYDILILSALESDGLLTWLNQEGYKLPNGAERILGSYIKQDMKFFVAKVNLAKTAESEAEYLSPIAIAYEDEDFMLPIRLGTLNADGSQDLIVFALTSEGRVETKNYKTRKIPTDKEVPLHMKEREGAFGDFYKAVFDRAVKKAGGSGVFMEYFFDIGSCDPCSAPPPTTGQMLELGVWWSNGYDSFTPEELSFDEFFDGADIDDVREDLNEPFWGDTFLTRLHVRYDARSFPADLTFQETGDDDEYFQGRYVVNIPWRGEERCEAADAYKQTVIKRQRTEIANVARMTGWKHRDIEALARTNGDIPFTLTPKPVKEVPEPVSDERKLYDQYIWWRGLFGPDTETTQP